MSKSTKGWALAILIMVIGDCVFKAIDASYPILTYFILVAVWGGFCALAFVE